MTMLTATNLIMGLAYCKKLPPTLLRGHARLHYTFTCRRPTDIKLSKVLTYSERLPSLKSYDPLIMWHTWGHLKIWKFFIFTIKRFMTSKPGRVLTYGRSFKTKTLKLSPASCYWISYLSFSTVLFMTWKSVVMFL